MFTFIFAIIGLVLGYMFYGKFVEKIFGIDPSKKTPAIEYADGLDYVELPFWKVFIIQFLNIAGTGPIFGAIAGAMWGPWAFVWIVFGCVFAGATHDLLVGMMSVRAKGTTISELVGQNLGETARKIMIGFSVILLLLVGVVFIASPADLLANLTSMNRWIFVALIFVYYLVATVLPVDKVIGKIYPIFGAALLIMCVGILGGMIFNGSITQIPEFSFSNPNPTGKSVFPYVCISIACGAISGFHATQTPLMARCIGNENQARKVFYGAMIAEGVVALIWAAASMTFFGGLEGLASAGPAAVVVNKISEGLLGPVGMVLAVLGVVACPITSGDTAFRSIRLTIGDSFGIDQAKSANRYKIVVPLFLVALALLFIDFNIIWRYFSWSNQTLAMIALWTAAAFLKKNGKNFYIAFVPAFFMTVVTTCYILVAPEGFYGLIKGFFPNIKAAETAGIFIGIALAVVGTFLLFKKVKKEVK